MTQLGLTTTLVSIALRLHGSCIAALPQVLTPRVGLVLILVVVLIAQYVRSPWRKIPPGPKGLPILGNALLFRDKRWIFGKDCKEKFRTSYFIITDSLNSPDLPDRFQNISWLCMSLASRLSF